MVPLSRIYFVHLKLCMYVFNSLLHFNNIMDISLNESTLKSQQEHSIFIVLIILMDNPDMKNCLVALANSFASLGNQETSR